MEFQREMEECCLKGKLIQGYRLTWETCFGVVSFFSVNESSDSCYFHYLFQPAFYYLMNQWWYLFYKYFCFFVHNTLSSAQKLPKAIFLTQLTHWRLLRCNFSARSPLFSGTDALFWRWCSGCHFASAITVSRTKSANLQYLCFLITHALLSDNADEHYRCQSELLFTIFFISDLDLDCWGH